MVRDHELVDEDGELYMSEELESWTHEKHENCG